MRSLKIILILLTNLFWISSVFPQENFEFLIGVNFSEKKLYLIDLREENPQVISSYQSAVPSSNFYPLPLYGKIVAIELDPYWFPTEKTREAFRQKNGKELPRIIKPGDPLNAMGAVKFVIEWEGNFNLPVVIHGTNQVESIGKKVTRGCVRLKNEEILGMTKTITGHKIRIVFKAE